MARKSFVVWPVLILAGVALLSLSGCGVKEQKEVLEQDLAEKKTELQLEFETSLQQLDTQIDTLEHHASQVGKQSAQDIQIKIDELKGLRSDMMDRLNGIDALTIDTFDDFKKQSEQLLNRANTEMHKAQEYIKQIG
jgi:DNA anti-recombination protein RmuC